jgi:hypothetical protein
MGIYRYFVTDTRTEIFSGKLVKTDALKHSISLSKLIYFNFF